MSSNIHVTVTPGNQYTTKIETTDIRVLLQKSSTYNASIHTPNTYVIENGDLYYRTADLAARAVTASYALRSERDIPPRFVLPNTLYSIESPLQAHVHDMYVYGKLRIDDGEQDLPFGDSTIHIQGSLIVDYMLYNMGVIENNGIIQTN